MTDVVCQLKNEGDDANKSFVQVIRLTADEHALNGRLMAASGRLTD